MEEETDTLPEGFASRVLEFRAIRDESREADFVASTDTIDSYGEIVAQNWDLARYLRNPVVLFAHKSSEIPIGHCTRVEMINGQLECTIKFSSAAANPKAEQVWQSVKEKALRAVSVGFRPRTVRAEVRNDQTVFVLDDNELHEISVTPIGANPDALAKMRARAFAAAQPKKEPLNGGADNTMNEEEKKALLARIAEKDAEAAARGVELTRLRASLDDASTKLEAVTAECTKACAERDALKSVCAELETKAVEAEVDALIGKKLKPAEREDFIKLRKVDKDLFARLVALKSDIQLGESVMPASLTDSAGTNVADPVEKTLALIDEKVG